MTHVVGVTGGSRRQQGAEARSGGQVRGQVGGAPGVYSTPPLAGQAQPAQGACCFVFLPSPLCVHDIVLNKHATDSVLIQQDIMGSARTSCKYHSTKLQC